MKVLGKHFALLVWLAGLVACVLVIASTRFVSDLSAFMPHAPNEREQVLISQVRDGIIGRLIMIGIEGGDAAQRARLSHELAGGLRRSGLFMGVQNGDEATQARDRAYFFQNRYLLSPDITPERFTAGGLHAAIADSVAALSDESGMLLKHIFPRDPTGEMLQLLGQFDGGSQPRHLDGVWASRDGTRAVMLAYTRAPGTDTTAQARAIATIRQVFGKLPGLEPDNRILMSGTSVFAVKSRNTIEGQVARLASASLLLVVCLLLLVYRSPRLLAFGLLPVLSGALVGITAVSLAFGKVQGLTMGFGTTLIGEAVDYSIYFFVQRLGQARLAHFWRTIWLGVATSIAGFAALLFSGFPGLAQLGVYTISGLIAAALVTRYVLPALVPANLRVRSLDRLGLALEAVIDRAQALRWLPLLLALAGASVVYLHAGKVWNPDLSSLSPISKADRRVDLTLRRDLGAPDLRYMAAFTAPNQELALQGAEKAGAVLHTLMRDKLIAGFTTPAAILPSLALQRARQEAIPDPATLRRNLKQALVGLPVDIDKLQGFLSDAGSARTRALLTRADLDGTSASMLFDSLLVKRSHDYLVLMPIRAPARDADAPLDIARIQKALQTTHLRDIMTIDLLKETTSLFENYRNEVLAMSEIGTLVIVGLLFISLKSVARTARVVAPLIAAVACDVALILLSGTELTILHLVGLLLVVAIGSNYALFFERLNRAGSPAEYRQTQVSLVVANLTTVGSFGILGFSSIPVLSAVGITVSLGAFLSLVFSAILSGGRLQSTPTPAVLP
ncbi:MAG: MMPL family transporter [Betaproteobacteria bacterium]|nr:MMPL family transporter [Betaproteobacteria bacterium]